MVVFSLGGGGVREFGGGDLRELRRVLNLLFCQDFFSPLGVGTGANRVSGPGGKALTSVRAVIDTRGSLVRWPGASNC